jgi:AraC-like DNA-binding protein
VAHALRAGRMRVVARRGERTGRPGPPETVLPDGRMEMVFHRADTFHAERNGALAPQPRSLLVGQITEPLRLQPGARVRTLGVRFRPAGAHAFLGARVHELTRRTARPFEVWGGEGAQLEEAVHAAASDSSAAEAAQRWLCRRLAAAPSKDRLVEAAVEEILRSGGQVRVEALGAASGLSRRQLQRRFRAAVGLGPKALARLVRLQAALQAAAEERRPPWVSLALECGFADQAHLAREFRQLAGTSPTRAAAELGALARSFLAPAQVASFYGEDPAE